jgi:hypothetical protein
VLSTVKSLIRRSVGALGYEIVRAPAAAPRCFFAREALSKVTCPVHSKGALRRGLVTSSKRDVVGMRHRYGMAARA